MQMKIQLLNIALTHLMPLSLSIPPENIRKPTFSDIFGGYRKIAVASNGLTGRLFKSILFHQSCLN